MQRVGFIKFGWEGWKIRLFLCAVALGALVGLGEVGAPLDNLMRDIRSQQTRSAPSGQIVVVAIDDKSIARLGRWPWPRQYHARMLNKLRDAGAAQVLVDIDFSSRSEPRQDRLLADALAAAPGRVTLPVQISVDPYSNERSDVLPIRQFRDRSELGTINNRFNFRGEIRDMPYALEIAGKVYPSYASLMSGVTGRADEWFPLDFSIDPRRTPTVSAADLLLEDFDPETVRDKIVIIGTTSMHIGDIAPAPGYGLLPGVYIHVMGAETLKAGRPVLGGWLIPYVVAILAVVGLLATRRDFWAAFGSLAAVSIAVLAQSLLEEVSIRIDITPALLVLLIVSGSTSWSILRKLYTGRGSRNAASGLPNLNVLRQDDHDRDLPLVVAKVHNFAEIASAFAASEHDVLIKQISDRLALVAHSRLHQSDDGIFAWLDDEETETSLRSLNTLYEVFRRPMIVLGTPVDVSITFGIDTRTDQSITSRLGSAVVAADEAFRSGMKWKECDQTQLAQTARKLSLMGQLDRAMANEEVWIAFQPKLDIATDRIIGAEALVRWDHFSSGEIDPLDFILAAERSGRIAELTDYVLVRALEATAKLRRAGIEFNMAVNLSGMLIDNKHLSTNVAKRLAAYGVLPDQLTLEITETAALAGHGGASRTLAKLRDMGVEIAIDDYGTGLSTLEYLKRIPATELKIDKSFIQAIDHSEADRLMVQSTINLAHSLGRKVVAEGVERPETLARLRVMGCDVAQGYLISRPLPYDRLEKLLVKHRRAA